MMAKNDIVKVGSNERGNIPIVLALVLGTVSAMGVYSLNDRIIDQKKFMNAVDAQELSRNANQSAAVYARSLLAVKNGGGDLPDNQADFPNVHLNDYFAPAAGGFKVVDYQGAGGPGTWKYTNNSAYCPSDPRCIMRDDNSWKVETNGWLRINTRTTTLAQRGQITQFYGNPNMAGLPGIAMDNFSWLGIANANRHPRRTDTLTSLELVGISTPPRLGLLATLAPQSMVNRYRVPLDPPPNPITRTLFTLPGGGLTPNIFADMDYEIAVQSRGITPRAKAWVAGAPYPAGCAFVQDRYNLPLRVNAWEANSYRAYGAGVYDTIWRCRFDAVRELAKAEINTVDPDGPSPTKNYQIYYNVAGLDTGSGPDECTDGHYDDGFCTRDRPGTVVPVVKIPNCRINVGQFDYWGESYANQKHFDVRQPWGSWIYVQAYGMVYDPSIGGAWATLQQWNEWDGSWPVIGNLGLAGYKSYEEASSPAYDGIAGGRSPQWQRGGWARFSRWVENKPNMWWVKNWLTFYGNFTGRPGLYFARGYVWGPGGSSNCDIPAQAGWTGDQQREGTFALWNQPVISNVTLLGTGPVAGFTAAEYASRPTLTFTAHGVDRCRVVRDKDGGEVCNVGLPWPGSFEKEVSFSCPLDVNYTEMTSYHVECYNPTFTNDPSWGYAASGSTPVIRRWCYGAGGPLQASYILKDKAEADWCTAKIASARGAMCDPDPDDCADMANEGWTWCDRAAPGYAAVGAWCVCIHGGRCNGAGVGWIPGHR